MEYIIELLKQSVIPLIITTVLSTLITNNIAKRSDKKLIEFENELRKSIEVYKVKTDIEFNTFGDLIEEIYNLTNNIGNILPNSISYIAVDDKLALFNEHKKEMRKSLIWVKKRVYILSPYLSEELVSQCKKLLYEAEQILRVSVNLSFEQVAKNDVLKNKVNSFSKQGDYVLENIQKFSRDF